MAAEPRTYTVIESDFYDQQEGLLVGVQVEAVPAGSPTQLLVTRISGADFPLEEPYAVNSSQLQAV